MVHIERARPALWPQGRAYLIACSEDQDLTTSLEELADLVRAAGAEVVGVMVQREPVPDSALYFGRGKAEELQTAALTARATLVVADDELAPTQRRNLERVVGLPVLDRTQVILDIFAQRARSREGKLQVELAQLTYLLPRLTGWGQTLSRLGGGIGTRGPGETRLEYDRRRIKRRIAELRRQIAEVARHREQHRRGRAALEMPVVALVGYTNAGKSTLLNALSGSQVSAKDRPFETLDPTVRRVYLAEGSHCLMTDTVGFIKKLPAHLVAAFRATLEEVTRADLLVHVVDASRPDVERQMQAVFETLEEIGAATRPVVLVFNKIDRAEGASLRALLDRYPQAIPVSALYRTNLDRLREAISEALRAEEEVLELVIPYSESRLLSLLYRRGRVIEQAYLDDAIRVRVALPESFAGRLAAYEPAVTATGLAVPARRRAGAAGSRSAWRRAYFTGADAGRPDEVHGA
ncbi:MAG: GTPase HflX [Firmicutes bacterium]|nr:GTPase HflX [Bacillota bacterium]